MTNPNHDMEPTFIGPGNAPTFSQEPTGKGNKAVVRYKMYTDAQGRRIEEEDELYQRQDRANKKQAKCDKKRARRQQQREEEQQARQPRKKEKKGEKKKPSKNDKQKKPRSSKSPHPSQEGE